MDTQREATRIGGRKAALGCLWMFLFFEAMVFFIGSHGDFMHEGGNYMRSQEDPILTSVVVVAFVIVFFLGRVAGRQILVMQKNHMMVALTSWAITMAILMGYLWVFSRIMKIVVEDWGTVAALLGLIMGCVWLIAVRGIKRAGAGH
ncbi:MAG TPA: hypothetical protein VL978_06675 [Puia sp.]|nr:hypothetical protein [Puia sp.]